MNYLGFAKRHKKFRSVKDEKRGIAIPLKRKGKKRRRSRSGKKRRRNKDKNKDILENPSKSLII